MNNLTVNEEPGPFVDEPKPIRLPKLAVEPQETCFWKVYNGEGNTIAVVEAFTKTEARKAFMDTDDRLEEEDLDNFGFSIVNVYARCEGPNGLGWEPLAGQKR